MLLQMGVKLLPLPDFAQAGPDWENNLLILDSKTALLLLGREQLTILIHSQSACSETGTSTVEAYSEFLGNDLHLNVKYVMSDGIYPALPSGNAISTSILLKNHGWDIGILNVDEWTSFPSVDDRSQMLKSALASLSLEL